jgi:hypothetical protein
MDEHRRARIDAVGGRRQRVQRFRSMPHGRSFRVAIFFWCLEWLSLVALFTALTALLRESSPTASRAVIVSLVLAVLFWLLAFFKRRGARCPLCRGTPLINTGAATHVRARRWFPLNHGQTAMLNIVACQQFRCMFCGSDFDLLKRPSTGQPGDESEEAGAPESSPHGSRS